MKSLNVQDLRQVAKLYISYFEIRQVVLKLMKSLGFKVTRQQTREMSKTLKKSRLSYKMGFIELLKSLSKSIDIVTRGKRGK